MIYVYNPACDCRVCLNGGRLPRGYRSGDNYDDPHRPPSRSPWSGKVT